MPTGQMWRKNDSGVWVKSGVLFKSSTQGWVKAVTGHIKNGDDTTWDLVYDQDVTPPPAPSFGSRYTYTDTKKFRQYIQMPSTSDVVRGCFKVSKTGYPTRPGEVTSGDTFTYADDSDGQPFWLFDKSPGSNVQRNFQSASYSTKYYLAAWAQDDSGNWSAPVTTSFTFPAAPAPTKKLVTKTAYITTNNSASYANFGWRSGDILYQAGSYGDKGFWFYGTKIASALKNAESIDKIQIYVYRRNTSHGVSGDAQVHIGRHGLTSKPSGSPGSNPITGEYTIGKLKRGEGQWFTLPSSWYKYFKSGSYRGLGVEYGTTSYTSDRYAIFNGYGTSSGKVKLTWKQYE